MSLRSVPLIAASSLMTDVLELAKLVAASDASVMITGGSGTGKEILARFIHAQSARQQNVFVAVNCAAIPEQLLESTLFGHEKGAFTGATQLMLGKFEQAQGGTLLLDEISEMPLALQAKLLRVLQEREVERVGAKNTIALDIRILATSNRNLKEEVAAGRFREDLFYRLEVFPIHLPSLKERKDDILPLATFFLEKYTEKNKMPLLALSSEACECLTLHDWPGNIRELENVIQRAVILSRGEAIEKKHLMLPPPQGKTNTCFSEGVQYDMREMEKKHILETLDSVNGVRKLAAEKLGISERTLRYKLQQFRDAVNPKLDH